MSGLEKRDFDQIINSLEDNYRHDLSVHLYLTFLSHRVNPHFPGPSWASWPLKKDSLPDMTAYDRYEDQIDASSVINNTLDTSYEPKANESIPVSRETVDNMFSKKQRLSVTYKNYVLVEPNRLLLNELQALILRKIHQKANLKQSDRVDLTTDENNILTRQMALKLANRLHELLKKTSEATYSESKGTWQDVHLRDLMFRNHGERLDVQGHRKRYAKSKRLFQDVKFNYEYSLSDYPVTGDEEANSEIEFEINHHLEALDTQVSKKRRTLASSAEILDKIKETEEWKDNAFNQLCAESESALCLSWKGSDRLRNFTTSEAFLSTERVDAVTTSTLSERDYIRKV